MAKPDAPLLNGSLLMIGAGNMGGAMLTGWLATGLDPAQVTICDPGLETVLNGIKLVKSIDNGALFDWVLIAIKPQMLRDVAPAIIPAIGSGTRVFSILAGVGLDVLRAWFPVARSIVRVMPNLAAAIGKSPVALVGEAGLAADDHAAISRLMMALGSAEWLESEDQLDLVTALAGSGPGFVYRFIDALAGAAAALGMDAAQAQRLAVAMVEGASALAAQSPHPPAELARRVASPGGVTQVGLDILDADQALARLIMATLSGAQARSADMSVAIGEASRP